MAGILRTLDGREHTVGGELAPIDCFRCGICCQRYQPGVGQEEIETIAATLGIGKEEFISRYVQQAPVKEGFLLRRSERGCLFLSRDEVDGRARCAIYQVRPKACRDWAASLLRQECRQGLAGLKLGGAILSQDHLPLQS